MDPRPGTTIADRYQLVRLIGSGGMGSVWAATHLVTGKDVALKVLSPTHAAKPEARRRFMREARAASLVRHANVVSIHDVVECDDTLAMVMDLLEGEDLGQRLEREGALSLPTTARILVPVISAVGTAHSRGVVHRDLKPENIFLVEDPADVRVLDFGIAKLTEHAMQQDGGLTNTGALLGTPYYMSPEQVFGEKDVDGRADVWSLGIILYECLAGVRPIEGDNAGQIMKGILVGEMRPLAEHVPDLPEEVYELVRRMIEHDRDQRLRDLREAFDVLAHYTDVSSKRFSRPRFTDPPSVSISPDSGSDPYARTMTPAWDQTGVSEVRGASTADELERVELAPVGRRGNALLDTGHPFEMPASRARSSKLLGVALIGLTAGVMLAVGWTALRASGPEETPAAASAVPSVAEIGSTASLPSVEVTGAGEVNSAGEPTSAADAASVATPAATSSASASASPQVKHPGPPSQPRSAAPASAGPKEEDLPLGVPRKVPF